MPAFAASSSIRYVALGDSYTIGTGASPQESWPAVAVSHLKHTGVPIELSANLGVNGWTTQNLIDGELPALKSLKPDFVTLLIGTNDWVQGVGAAAFEKNLHYILQYLTKNLADPKAILVVTVPDFSVTPAGREYSGGRDIAAGLTQFNRIILKEAQDFGLATADLFALSQSFANDPSLIAQDGLHPSAKGYAKWAGLIEPVMAAVVKPPR